MKAIVIVYLFAVCSELYIILSKTISTSLRPTISDMFYYSKWMVFMNNIKFTCFSILNYSPKIISCTNSWNFLIHSLFFFIFRQGKVLNCYTSSNLPHTLRQLGVLKILWISMNTCLKLPTKGRLPALNGPPVNFQLTQFITCKSDMLQDPLLGCMANA